jgi:L-asparaginase
MSHASLPGIAIFGTGGTIAATAASTTGLVDYTVTEGVNVLLAAVPQISQLANLHQEQLFNVDSREFSNDMLVELATRINRVLSQADVAGAVVTHGTDTLEETAYFLNLTVKSSKPVVVVGAMRPASAISADGPLNLYNAIRLASHPSAGGRGVMVAMNDEIHAARFVSKAHTTQVDAFHSPGHGCLGQFNDERVYFLQSPGPLHTLHSEFTVPENATLPRVDIIYDHQDAGIHHYQASVATGAQGIIVAGTGNGGLTPGAQRGVAHAKAHQLVCVRASRVGSGIVSPAANDTVAGVVSANSLNPQKARILLMLALMRTCDPTIIQASFDRY